MLAAEDKLNILYEYFLYTLDEAENELKINPSNLEAAIIASSAEDALDLIETLDQIEENQF